jgi:hypothetical protein
VAEFKRVVFQNIAVYLDGNKYENCTFQHVNLVFAGGELPSFKECTFIDSGFAFDGAAARTMAVIRSIYHGFGEEGKQIVDGWFMQLKEPPPPRPQKDPAARAKKGKKPRGKGARKGK